MARRWVGCTDHMKCVSVRWSRTYGVDLGDAAEARRFVEAHGDCPGFNRWQEEPVLPAEQVEQLPLF